MRRSGIASAAIVLSATLTLLAPVAAPGQATGERANLPDIEDEVMCPVCGTTLELAEAPQAERQRELIRRLIDRGLTKDEVKDELVAEFGEEVLAAPSTSGFDLTAWLMPGLGLALALGVLLTWVARSRRRDPVEPAGDLDPADAARLESDLASHDA